MGTISLQIPVLGQPDTTEAPKLINGFTTLQTVINGQIDDSNLRSPLAAKRQQLLTASGNAQPVGLASSTTYILPNGSIFNVTASGLTGSTNFWYGDTTGDFTVANKSSQAVLRVATMTNTIAPAITLTFGLYQVTSLGGASGTVVIGGASLVTGSSIASALSSASAAAVVESAAFTLPTTSAAYFIGATSSGTGPANSAVNMTAQLLGFNT